MFVSGTVLECAQARYKNSITSWGPCLFRQEPENSLFAQDVSTASISSDMRKELEGYRETDDKYAIVINRIKKNKAAIQRLYLKPTLLIGIKSQCFLSWKRIVIFLQIWQKSSMHKSK